MLTDDDALIRDRLRDFVDRFCREHPSHFEVILCSAAESRLRSLRCEPLGVGAFRLVRTPQGEGEMFETLVAERLSMTVFACHGVESSQLGASARR